MSMVLADRTHKSALDWFSQAAWLLGALVGGPMLLAREYPVHGIGLMAVAFGSVAWIEYVVRTKHKGRAAVVAAGIMGGLALTANRDNEGDH